jgi:GNAT superfamily N-acetyltransferase
VQELREGIYLRRAQEKDARAIAVLVQQLGRTLHGPGNRSWLLLLIWFGVGLWGILALYRWSLAIGILSALLGMGLPLAVFLGLLSLVAWLNPMVTWSDYWVIESNGSLIACAKLYEGDNSCELYDVFVVPHWRGNGFGTLLVETLKAEARYPIYLACLPNAIGFYEQLGFVKTREILEISLMRRLSLHNPQYQKLGLTPMVLGIQK